MEKEASKPQQLTTEYFNFDQVAVKDRPHFVLEKSFGFNSFHEHQFEIIQHVPMALSCCQKVEASQLYIL